MHCREFISRREVKTLKENKSEYRIPNCTPNQLIRLLEALRDGGAEQHLINVLIEDKDAHHQRDMAVRLGLVEKLGEKYALTDLGERVVLLCGSDKFAKTFRDECIPRMPIFRDMLRVIRLAKQMTKDELKKKIVSLADPNLELSSSTLDQYANLVIAYLKLGKFIEYQRNRKLVKYSQ
jgi:hypothetical protein